MSDGYYKRMDEQTGADKYDFPRDVQRKSRASRRSSQNVQDSCGRVHPWSPGGPRDWVAGGHKVPGRKISTHTI